MIVIELEQGSQAWLDYRKMRIGASDSAVVLGVSPWSTPKKLWRLKLGLDRQEENFAMKRGTELEPVARAMYEENMGCSFPPIVTQHDDFDWLMASLDGYDSINDRAVEIKCGGAVLFAQAENGIIPEHYRVQLQHQMEVMDLEVIDYAVYFDGNIAVVEEKRDQKLIDKIIIEGSAFVNKLEHFSCPDMQDGDYEKRAGPRWVRLASELRAVRARMQDDKALEAEILNDLKDEAAGVNSIGSGVKLTNRTRIGSVDYKIIPELKDVDLDLYRKKASKYVDIRLISE